MNLQNVAKDYVTQNTRSNASEFSLNQLRRKIIIMNNGISRYESKRFKTIDDMQKIRAGRRMLIRLTVELHNALTRAQPRLF